MSYRTVFFFVGLLTTVTVLGIFSLKPDKSTKTVESRLPKNQIADVSATALSATNHSPTQTSQADQQPTGLFSTETTYPQAQESQKYPLDMTVVTTDTADSEPSTTDAEHMNDVMAQIEKVYTQSAQGEKISPKEINSALAGLDEAVSSGGMALYEAVEIKGFLLGLMENPPKDLVDTLAVQTAKVEAQAAAGVTDRERFEAYKREEARLIARIDSAYGDSPEQAKQILETERAKLKASFSIE